MSTNITDISQLDLDKRYTYADYLLWRFQESVELIKGKIFKMTPAPSTKHQEISVILTGEFYNYFKKHSCKAFSAPFDVRLSKSLDDKKTETVVQPDLCVICDLSKLDEKGCHGAPDLVVEILSPSTSAKDVNDKYQLYEENEVKEYWIVDPTNGTVLKYMLNNKGKYASDKLKGKEEVIQSSIFPDLEINLGEVFDDWK